MAEDDFKPRNYQVELMKIAVEKNTIIYLPTGAGKTYIAILVLKHLSTPITIPWNDGGKVTILLVNTVALVHQHAKYLKRHTPFNVGSYTGELNVDFWDEKIWHEECQKFQILVMTCQILTNAVERNVLDLNRVNLLIFDECHRGVNDQPMRQLMKRFEHVREQPRVLGLTATLLNGNCRAYEVMKMVEKLETTYHSKVATVDELRDVLGYSTNPREAILCYQSYELPPEIKAAIAFLEESAETLRKVFLTEQKSIPQNLEPLDPVKGQTELANILKDTIIHIEMLGIYGGIEAINAHTIQIECMKTYCDDENFCHILNFVITSLTHAKRVLSQHLSASIKNDLETCSSPKVRQLFRILRNYKNESQEELCAIVFVHRRFTAKVLYHLLKLLSENVTEFSFIKPNFIVGYNSNPFNQTRESLYYNKVNREVIQGFFAKEHNILVSSNVLEEGIDVPTCTLVIKFDEPLDYRAYVQSKGRARHKDSLYYMMIQQQDSQKFRARYKAFQTTEDELNKYLIGQNEIREGPNERDLRELYEEDELPPYYVDGPNSAQVNMVSAVGLLSAYCNSFESDVYTSYAPNWYMQKQSSNVRVVIELPTVCAYVEPIVGKFMRNKKQAKRAAALKACEILHQKGELDNNLRPIKRTELKEETNYLFSHWPAVKETGAGNSKNVRLHKICRPRCCMGSIVSNTTAYLHIIDLSPSLDMSNISAHIMAEQYESNLCFGIISINKFPNICKFPLYERSGKIEVNIKNNVRTISLSTSDIEDIRQFNHLVYNDVLGLLKTFLIMDNEDSIFVVPVDKQREEIDFDVIKEHKTLKNKLREPTREERLSLEVSETTFLSKIVTPWYRKDDTAYLVTNICNDLNANSAFPGDSYPDYATYFKNLYQCTILNKDHPLLRVKALSNATNYLKPSGNKKHKDSYLNYTIHLVPELVIVQDFPSCLWLQAKLLPSVFDKLLQLFRIEELRTAIATATGIGLKHNCVWKPLHLDEYLINFDFDSDRENDEIETDENVEVLNMENILSLTNMLNKEVVSNTLQEDYPWEKSEEPVDIERNLDVTLMEIQHYLNFIKQPTQQVDRQIRNSPVRQKPAITYDVDFVPVNIKMLDIAWNPRGPELADLFKAFATAKCCDIVNLERLETLGDSFLKFIISVFIILNYPKYDEGNATTLKGKMVSNRNLYYLAANRNLASYLKYYNLLPQEDWCPPGFCLPPILRTRSMPTTLLLTTTVPTSEQISGVLSEHTKESIERGMAEQTVGEENCNNSINYYLGDHHISDKFVADSIESVLGVYLESCGITGAICILKWLEVIPDPINLSKLFSQPPPNPLLNENATQKNIDFLIPSYQKLEKNLGYTFKNRAYLLEALTHSSYISNRYTRSYQRLEFLGDAILDFLVTMHIYETCEHLTPGDLTDLRSAIVNNITFACFSVRCGFHQHLLAINNKLQAYIDKFVKYQENKNFCVNDDVLILLNEDDFHIAEYVDAPKVLGDVFESLAGAVFLDSGFSLKTVWDVFYKIMWREINEFRNNVPKNAVRVLYETVGAHPVFHKPVETQEGKVMVKLDFMINGSRKRVHGFGDNKTVAKRAAAKIALRLLG